MGWGGYWPWYAGWGLGWGYPYDYGYYYYPAVSNYYYYSYPDAGNYYYSYAPSSYDDSGAVADSDAAVAPDAVVPEPLADSSVTAPTTSEDQPAPGEAPQFYSQARAAFLNGDYRNALRLAGHAALDAPRNPKVHELASLALFALGNYTAAANEAHVAMALGPVADWPDLYGYYNDLNKYTTQLRALEKASLDDPASAADHFLLGYHYLMTGAPGTPRPSLHGQ